jgi:hypothetical protein
MKASGRGVRFLGAPVGEVMLPTIDNRDNLTPASNSLRWCPVSKQVLPWRSRRLVSLTDPEQTRRPPFLSQRIGLFLRRPISRKLQRVPRNWDAPKSFAGASVMDRRAFLKTAAGAGALTATGRLSTPALSQRAAAAALRFVPIADLSNFDPIWNINTVSRSAGLLVWDTLYGVDTKLQP